MQSWTCEPVCCLLDEMYVPFTYAMTPITPIPPFLLWESDGSRAVRGPALSLHGWNAPEVLERVVSVNQR